MRKVNRALSKMVGLRNLILYCGAMAQNYVAKDLTKPGEFTAEIEGACTDKNGNIYAVSFDHKETIGQVTPLGGGKIFIEMPEGQTANAIRFDSKEQMFVADYTGHNILKYNDEEKQLEIFAHNSNMNQPNDIAIMDNDIIFASDPNWAENTGQMWRINLDGSTTLLEKNMGTTNGIEVSPDQKTLYVNESNQLKIWAYDLSPTGEVSNKRLFKSFEEGGLDGMRCDIQGNIYLTRWSNGVILKLSPDAQILEEIQLTGKRPTNLAFGGEDGKTVYVTEAERGVLEYFRVESPGRSWVLRQSRK